MTLLPWPAEFGPTFPTGLPLARPRINGPYAVAVAAIDTSPDAWSVNLSPPPLDAQGYPTRIDALPEVVARLARAMGHPDGVHCFRNGKIRPDSWGIFTFRPCEEHSCFTLFCHDGGGDDSDPLGGWTMVGEDHKIIRRWPRIPALASIDPTDPNATRLAVSAIVAARPWSADVR